MDLVEDDSSYQLPLKRNRLSLSPPPKLKKSIVASKFASPVLNRLTPIKGSFPYSSFNPAIGETHIEQCFKIICKIGEGSYGNVFKVQRHSDKCIFAAKVTKAPFLSEQDRDRKIHEVKIHYLFSDHINIVTLYDAWEERGYLYMLMEYCKETLTNITKRNHYVTERTVWKMLHDILQALDFIHSKEIVHMDVKMANIMIGQDRNFKLIDFGISGSAKGVHFQNMCGGDQRYIAPEIIHQRCTKAADIFSLGVVALEMAGDFILPHEVETLAKLRRGILPSNHNLSPELSGIIRCMLLPDPTKRSSTAELLSNKFLVEETKNYQLECSKNKIYQIKSCYSNYISVIFSKVMNILRYGITLLTGVFFNQRNIPIIIEPKTPESTPEEVLSVSSIVSATPPGLTSSGIKESNLRCFNIASARRHALTNLTLKNSMSPARNLKHEFSSDDEA